MSRSMTKWRLLGPSIQLMFDPPSGARAVIRDTCGDHQGYLWRRGVQISLERDQRSFSRSPLDAPAGLHGRGRSPRRPSAPIPRIGVGYVG